MAKSTTWGKLILKQEPAPASSNPGKQFRSSQQRFVNQTNKRSSTSYLVRIYYESYKGIQ